MTIDTKISTEDMIILREITEKFHLDKSRFLVIRLDEFMGLGLSRKTILESLFRLRKIKKISDFVSGFGNPKDFEIHKVSNFNDFMGDKEGRIKFKYLTRDEYEQYEDVNDEDFTFELVCIEVNEEGILNLMEDRPLLRVDRLGNLVIGGEKYKIFSGTDSKIFYLFKKLNENPGEFVKTDTLAKSIGVEDKAEVSKKVATLNSKLIKLLNYTERKIIEGLKSEGYKMNLEFYIED